MKSDETIENVPYKLKGKEKQIFRKQLTLFYRAFYFFSQKGESFVNLELNQKQLRFMEEKIKEFEEDGACHINFRFFRLSGESRKKSQDVTHLHSFFFTFRIMSYSADPGLVDTVKILGEEFSFGVTLISQHESGDPLYGTYLLHVI